MANYSTNDFKPGLKVMLDGNPCSIMENEYVKPGKGQAFNRVKLRNLKTGKVLEKTFKSGDYFRSSGHRRSRNELLVQRWRNVELHGPRNLRTNCS